MTFLVAIFVVLFGLAFGSFLNVCISRLPRHASIVRPPSHCPNCGTQIRALDNIPLLSWLLLRGRCRRCQWPIPWRYPLVEFATAALFLLAYLVFGAAVQAAAMALLCFLLLGLAVMDAETLLLPDAFTVPGIALGIVYAGTTGGWRGVGFAALWAIAGAAVILLIRGAYWLLRKQEGMGLGDAKLLAMIGAWLGWQNGLLVLFLGVVVGAVFGLAMKAARRTNTALPFGSFLCAAAIYAIFFGSQTIAWYLQFFR